MRPGKLGIIGNWDEAKVTRICEDVHENLKDVCQVGWIILKIDDKPFNLKTLKKKITGRFNYKLTFQTGVTPH